MVTETMIEIPVTDFDPMESLPMHRRHDRISEEKEGENYFTGTNFVP
jgi:hypothetical protein